MTTDHKYKRLTFLLDDSCSLPVDLSLNKARSQLQELPWISHIKIANAMTPSNPCESHALNNSSSLSWNLQLSWLTDHALFLLVIVRYPEGHALHNYYLLTALSLLHRPPFQQQWPTSLYPALSSFLSNKTFSNPESVPLCKFQAKTLN